MSPSRSAGAQISRTGLSYTARGGFWRCWATLESPRLPKQPPHPLDPSHHHAPLGREYGRDLLMTGGIDKRVLARDRQAIDAELAARVPVAAGGGYIPHLDHGIPHDVPYANFAYYWERKKQLLGVG